MVLSLSTDVSQVLPHCSQGCHFYSQVAEQLENAVTAALDAGYRTGDLHTPGMQKVGCSKMGDMLAECMTREFASVG